MENKNLKGLEEKLSVLLAEYGIVDYKVNQISFNDDDTIKKQRNKDDKVCVIYRDPYTGELIWKCN